MWERDAADLRTLADGLQFPEGPRWHEGALWFSDMRARTVLRLDLAGGAPETVLTLEHQTSGLGWLPDGRLLIVSMEDRRLMRREPDGAVVEAADLSPYAAFHCNDMLVDGAGRAYIGNFGFDAANSEPRGATLCRADPDGTVTVVADDLAFPNGTVLTPDGRTMIVAESVGHQLTAFDVDGRGDLSGRRVWAALEGAAPDGMCLDAEGAVWVASPISKDVLRVAEGGRILGRVATGPRRPLACMLGGDDRRTLLIASVGRHKETEVAATGQIDAIEVEVPGAGLP